MGTKSKKIVLYNPNPLSKHRLSIQAPLALLSISKILDKEGYGIHIISPILHKPPFDELLKRCENAICLGLTCMTGHQIKDGLDAAKLVRKKYPKLPIVWGGWHPSMEPEQTLDSQYVDVVVRGQGERTFTELVHCLEGGKSLKDILGISYKKDGKIFHNPDRPIENINNFPPMPYHLIDVEKCLYTTEYGSRTINYVSSYGCPFKCNFCEEQVVYKRKWSGLDAKRIVDDIECLIKNYKIDAIAFHDSNFFVDKNRVEQFCKELIKRDLKIKWGNANGRAKQLVAYDDNLWALLEKSGLYQILTGAESGLQEMLDEIDKGATIEDTINFAKKCKEYNIKGIFSFFVGIPWSSDYNKTQKLIEKELEYTLELINKLISMDRRNRMILSLFTPYPGSPMYFRSVEFGFKPPENFEGWSTFLLEKGTTPWISFKMAKHVEKLTTYIFFFMDSESYVWTSERIKNRWLRLIFKCFFRMFEKIVLIRWKYKFFGFDVDYKLYSFVRNHGARFGFYQS